MEIIIAKSSGFCFGVKRAISMAETCGMETKEPIFTLGPIIHNPQVVGKLEKEAGVYVKKSIDEIESGTVIIRSHGAKYEEIKAAKDKGLTIVDATCPFVKKSQELVNMLSADGYFVIIAGEKEHPEVKGLVSYASQSLCVADSIEGLVKLPRVKKIGIVAQTTLPFEKLEAIVAYCLGKAPELKIFNTICNATSIRQRECADLAKKVDVMIIAGGKNSANTCRLADICVAIQPRTYHVETADEIDPAWLANISKVGVTSGASTPDWVISGVVEKLKAITN